MKKLTSRWLAGLLMAALCAVTTLNTQAQGQEKERLEKSPRHQEWVKLMNGSREVHAFVVYPEVKKKAPVVIVIHENKGLTDWVRGVADQLAEAGYIAIAPDFLSGSAPKGGKTSDFESVDAATKAIYALSPDQVTGDLDAAAAYASKSPAGNGSIAVAGFCWGGAQTFRYATHNKDVKTSMVFYGTGPDKEEDYKRIQSPVYGFYGSNDERVNSTIPKSTDAMKKHGKMYEPVLYEGAGHGFMRAGETADGSPANKKGREEAWKRVKEILSKL